MSYKFSSIPKKTLYQSILSTSTTFKMSDITGFDGNDLTSADFGTVAYGVLLNSDKSVMELFSFDPSTIANTSISFVYRGLQFDGDLTTEVAANKLDWTSDSTILIGTDTPQVLQWLKEYIDGIAISGSPDASTTIKGISKLSTAPASPTEPIAVGDNDPRIPSTDKTSAMDGSQGVPNANNKYVTEDNVYTAEADQSQTTQNGTVEFGMVDSSTNKNIICQSFIPLKTKIRGIKLYKSANTGTFTGTVTVSLFADSAGSPTGSALATGTLTNAVYNALPVGEFEVLFASEYSMTAGSTYWFKASASTADSSNHPNLGTNTAGGYANGSVKYYNGTDGYVAITNIDLYFKTLQGVISQVIKTNNNGNVPPQLYSEGYLGVSLEDIDTTAAVNTTLTKVVFSKMLPSSFFNTKSGLRFEGYINSIINSVNTSSKNSTLIIKLGGNTLLSVIIGNDSTGDFNILFKYDILIFNNNSLASQKIITKSVGYNGTTVYSVNLGSVTTNTVDTSSGGLLEVIISSAAAVSSPNGASVQTISKSMTIKKIEYY